MQSIRKKIQIECGILGDKPTRKDSFFFPVLKLKPLEFNFSFKDTESFGICFTSKNAVDFFLQKFQSNIDLNKFLSNCFCIGAVGEKTAEYVKAIFPSALLKLTKNIIYPKDELGLKNLLYELNKITLKNRNIYIFTGLSGKTSQIISENEKYLKLNLYSVPVYDTTEIDNNLCIKLLNEIIGEKKVSDADLIFYAKSGQVINSTIKILMSYFEISLVDNLPASIFFIPWEKSAKNVLNELKLIDRDIS
ncbi:uroporphyrinogen-III synthase [Pigmentibacter ruber]